MYTYFDEKLTKIYTCTPIQNTNVPTELCYRVQCLMLVSVDKILLLELAEIKERCDHHTVGKLPSSQRCMGLPTRVRHREPHKNLQWKGADSYNGTRILHTPYNTWAEHGGFATPQSIFITDVFLSAWFENHGS